MLTNKRFVIAISFLISCAALSMEEFPGSSWSSWSDWKSFLIDSSDNPKEIFLQRKHKDLVITIKSPKPFEEFELSAPIVGSKLSEICPRSLHEFSGMQAIYTIEIHKTKYAKHPSNVYEKKGCYVQKLSLKKAFPYYRTETLFDNESKIVTNCCNMINVFFIENHDSWEVAEYKISASSITKDAREIKDIYDGYIKTIIYK